jgi:tRNA-specific 2-thiouridylase
MSTGTAKDTVAVALSGGVDSSVAAALMVQEGHEVIGVTLRQWTPEQLPGGPIGGSDRRPIARARRVCDLLAIPFQILDARAAFKSTVVDYLVKEYATGRTPNPCVECNRTVRFGLLLQEVLALGASRLATGHYARVRRSDGGWDLLRGRDRGKDQSYFLHTLDQARLSRCLFPLGERTKSEVRALSLEYGLPVEDAQESQDICFLAGSDYRLLLASRAPQLMEEGPIVDQTGRVLGRHKGLACYTVGQRKGLGLAAPSPLYVTAVRVADNTLVVGARDKLLSEDCQVSRMSYVGGEPPGSRFRAQAQVRYRSPPVPVSVRHESPQAAHVHFDHPVSSVAPGQFLVLYEQDRVIGGGVICERV